MLTFSESAIIILEVKWHLQSFREIHTAATGYMTGQRIHTTACSVNNTQYKSALFQPTLENPHHQIFSYPECVTRSVVYVNGTDLCRSKEWHTVRLTVVNSCSSTLIVSIVYGFLSQVEGEE